MQLLYFQGITFEFTDYTGVLDIYANSSTDAKLHIIQQLSHIATLGDYKNLRSKVVLQIVFKPAIFEDIEAFLTEDLKVGRILNVLNHKDGSPSCYISTVMEIKIDNKL